MFLKTGTFRDPASKLFHSLPNDIKLRTNANTFVRIISKLFKTRAESRLDCICLIVLFCSFDLLLLILYTYMYFYFFYPYYTMYKCISLMNVEPLHKKVINKPLLLLLLSASTGLLWSCCGSKVSLSERPKKERECHGRKKKKKYKREKRNGAFSSLLNPLSPITSPFSPLPYPLDAFHVGFSI